MNFNTRVNGICSTECPETYPYMLWCTDIQFNNILCLFSYQTVKTCYELI